MSAVELKAVIADLIAQRRGKAARLEILLRQIAERCRWEGIDMAQAWEIARRARARETTEGA